MTIDRVTMYKCPETGKLFKTKKGAENSAKRAKEAKELSSLAKQFDSSGLGAQQDYVRLNATSPKHIIDLVVQKAEEFWGLKVTKFEVSGPGVYSRQSGTVISFGQCDIEVNSAGSCRLAYMREKAKIGKGSWYSEPSIYDLLFSSMGFRGFTSGGGNPGRCSDSDEKGYPFRMCLMSKLEEFPLINQSHQEWIAHEKEYEGYEHKKRVVMGYGLSLALSSTEYEKLSELRSYHRDCEEIVKKSIRDLENYYTDGLVKKWMKINPPVVKNLELWGILGG